MLPWAPCQSQLLAHSPPGVPRVLSSLGGSCPVPGERLSLAAERASQRGAELGAVRPGNGRAVWSQPYALPCGRGAP